MAVAMVMTNAQRRVPLFPCVLDFRPELGQSIDQVLNRPVTHILIAIDFKLTGNHAEDSREGSDRRSSVAKKEAAVFGSRKKSAIALNVTLIPVFTELNIHTQLP